MFVFPFPFSDFQSLPIQETGALLLTDAVFFCSFSLQGGMSTQLSAICCCRTLDVEVGVIVAVVVDNAARSLGAQHPWDEEGALPSKLNSAEFQTLVSQSRSFFLSTSSGTTEQSQGGRPKVR